MATTIDEVARIGDVPGTPDGTVRPTAGTTVHIKANALQEYVAGGVGGSGQWYANVWRTWPWALDDVTQDFGDDLYERMLLDAQVASAVQVLKASILEDGVQFSTAVEDASQDGYVIARTICDTVTDMFDDLDTAADEVLWDMLDAVALGNRVAEQVYRMGTNSTGAPCLLLSALRPKPRHATAFVVDSFSRVQGLVATIPGHALSVQAGQWIDPTSVPNLLPRHKFAVLSFRPRNGDPRGTSILRPAYNPWNLKNQVLREHVKYLTQFASPSLIGYTAEHADAEVKTDDLGNVTDTRMTPEQAMAVQLANFKNGTALAVPFGSKVDILHNQGEGHAFLAAIDLYDRQITKSILGQTLASEEGKHMARASALVHQDILDTIVKQAKRAVERMIVRDILQPWIRYNYGEAVRDLAPLVTLGTTEQPNMVPMMASIAALQTSGYFAPSQYTTVDQLMGLPSRLPEEIPDPVTIAAAAAAAATKAAPAATPPGPADAPPQETPA